MSARLLCSLIVLGVDPAPSPSAVGGIERNERAVLRDERPVPYDSHGPSDESETSRRFAVLAAGAEFFESISDVLDTAQSDLDNREAFTADDMADAVERVSDGFFNAGFFGSVAPLESPAPTPTPRLDRFMYREEAIDILSGWSDLVVGKGVWEGEMPLPPDRFWDDEREMPLRGSSSQSAVRSDVDAQSGAAATPS